MDYEIEFHRVLKQCHYYYEMADKLADAMAGHLDVDIGDHTICNNPWHNILDYISALAEQGNSD